MANNTLLEKVSQHLEQQQAEVTSLRLVLMAFVSRLLGANPEYAEERLNDLKTLSLTMLGNMTFDFEEATPDKIEHARTQIEVQLKSLFRDFERALSEARTIRGESGRH